MNDSWPPPTPPLPPESWPPPQGSPTPYVPLQQPAYWAPQKTTEDKLLEWAIPINRSGLAVASGYVALVSVPLVILGPIAVLLGILALRDIASHPERLGKGRAWFAIVYGGFATLLMAWLVSGLFLRGN